MKLPSEWKVFARYVMGNIQTYCDSQIWTKQYNDYVAWLNNFKGNDLDFYVALHLLDSLIFRSNAMVESSYCRFLNLDLRSFLVDHQIINRSVSIKTWRSNLQKGSRKPKNLYFSGVKLKNDKGDSGEHIVRILSGNIVSQRLFVGRDELSGISTHGSVIVLVDDFAGSGDQFISYANEINLSSLSDLHTIVYAPFMAIPAGVERIKKDLPKISIMPLETLGQECGFFYQEGSHFKNDMNNSANDFKQHIISMKSRYAGSLPDWLGRDNSSLCVAFEWGCPNQTFPILWMQYSPSHERWQPLFRRRS